MKNRRILIGVTGGVAIYKVLSLISKLKKADYDIRIIMTESRTKMISPLLFETMGRCEVYTDTFSRDNNGVTHIDISKDCDLFLIAPATANIMAKVKNGIADDLLSTAILASSAKVAFAPAMNTRMLNNPITKDNINTLMNLGYFFIESNPGFLACNEIGDGRMAEPDEIYDEIEYLIEKKDLKSKKIIVTGGSTVVNIDPVRFISNHSSGKMGYEIARNARNRGADVTLILGKTDLIGLRHVNQINVLTNQEMKEEIEDKFDSADALIMAAAPMDFDYKEYSDEKIKKTNGFTLELVSNIDILKYFGSIKKKQTLIGFAAETDKDRIYDYAKEKLLEKKLDYIVANNVTTKGAGFNVDTNIATIISKDEIKELPMMSKSDLGNIILDKLV